MRGKMLNFIKEIEVLVRDNEIRGENLVPIYAVNPESAQSVEADRVFVLLRVRKLRWKQRKSYQKRLPSDQSSMPLSRTGIRDTWPARLP